MGTKFNTQYFDVSVCHCSTVYFIKWNKILSLKIEMYLLWLRVDFEICGAIEQHSSVLLLLFLSLLRCLFNTCFMKKTARATLDYHFNKLLLMLIIFNVMRYVFPLSLSFTFLVYPQMLWDIPWLWIENNEQKRHMKYRAIVWITANLGVGSFSFWF